MHSLWQFLTNATASLRGPAEALFDPGRRIFIPFILCSGLIAVVVFSLRGLSVRRALRAVFSRSVWLHPSARGDYKLIAARTVLGLFSFGARGVSALAVAAVVMSWLRVRFGRPDLDVSAVTIGATYTLGVFILEDLGRFAIHWLLHRVPFLWEFHKLHHEAEVLTPLTLYRTHPVEGFLNASASAFVVGLSTGVFAWLFGPHLHAWQLFGVDALGFVWAMAGSNLRHSHVWLSYGRSIEKFFLSPAQHQIHHSAAPEHQDRNFGTAIALWDRFAGTLYLTTPTREPLIFGLGDGSPPPDHSVIAMLTKPIVRALKRLVPRVQPSRSMARARGALFAMVSTTAVIMGCTPTPFDRAALLQGFGRCTMGVYDRFATAADGLNTAAAAYAQTPDTAHRDAARRAWESAIDIWEQAELLRYGPTGELNVVGGRGLREQVYSWPDVNRCLIDQRTVSQGYTPDSFANLPTSARGLAAIEYLLFYEGTDNGCAATETINTDGSWTALTPDELTRRRAAYASAAAAGVLARAREINTAWAPRGFYDQLVTAGQGSTLFSSQELAYSAVADATFHLDTEMKDRRLGQPLGLNNCTTPTCPDALESQWADRGRNHLRNNIAGLRLTLEGCAAGNNLGFDDLLQAAGAGTLVTKLRTDLDAAEAAVDALPSQSLRQSLTTDRASVMRIYTAVKELTDFLKNEFTVTLSIRAGRVEGDND